MCMEKGSSSESTVMLGMHSWQTKRRKARGKAFWKMEKNWVRTGRTELPVRPLAPCRTRTMERRRLPTARGSVSRWRCSSAHFLFLVLSSLPFLHSSSFRSAADRDPWPEPPRIPITGAAADPHHRSCSRSPSPEPPRCPLPAVPPLPRA